MATPDEAIYAYEDGALWTFQARRAAVWNESGTSRSRTIRPSKRFWRGSLIAGRTPWMVRRLRSLLGTTPQRRELALATQISVASAFTKQSLERFDLNVPIVVTPYGFPTDSLPATGSTRLRGHSRCSSVGTHDLRKGTPYLLEAWKRAAIPGRRAAPGRPAAAGQVVRRSIRGHLPPCGRTSRRSSSARATRRPTSCLSDAGRRVRLGHPGGDVLWNAGRHDAVRRRPRMHHRRGRRVDCPAPRHRRAGRTASVTARRTATGS